MTLDRAWAEAVVAHLLPVFDADGSHRSFHGIADPPGDGDVDGRVLAE